MYIIFMISLFFVEISYCASKDLKCGFPGTPAYGFVKSNKAAYEEGEVVMYNCHVGYILLGSPISRCKGDGSWSEDVPVCDDSMTTLVLASSTPTVPGFPAELAIDKNKEKCTYLQPKKPRWWRIDLGDNREFKVLSVAITMMPKDTVVKFTVFVIQIQNQIASYKRCASFSGKFGTPTVVLSCTEGKGILGHKVHIEDHNQLEGVFEICEVEIQVEKDTGYDCGVPSRSLYSEATVLNNNFVEYDCLRGYEIVGKETRVCLKTGQWSGVPPKCKPILCDELEPFENGVYQIRHGNEGAPLEGAIVIYNCNNGYKSSGPSTRTCRRDGSWTGKAPACKAIRCPIPDGRDVGGVYRLINKTNSMGSLAVLRCKGGKIEGDNPYITCTEDGEWTEPEASCIIPARASAEKKEQPRIAKQGGIIFGMVLAAVMIVVVLVGVYLYDQRRRNNKPDLPSRLLEPPTPPPRPPPRSKGSLKSAFKGFLNRESSNSDKLDKNSWKTQSLPSNQASVDDADLKLNSKKALSYSESLPSGEIGPAVVEVEVLPPYHSGRISTVPEEPENAASEDVILELEETDSNKDSSAKENKNESDYASIDYEKKRQSRLLKEQDSLDSSSTAPGSPLPMDESDKKELSGSVTPPKRLDQSEEEEEEDGEEEEESESEASSQHTRTDTDDSQKQRKEEERIAKEEEENKVKEEEERKVKEEEERKAKEEEERKAKEEEERKAKEEEERKAKEEEEKKKAEEEQKAKEEEEKKKKEETEKKERRRRTRDAPTPPAVEDKPVLRRFRKFQ